MCLILFFSSNIRGQETDIIKMYKLFLEGGVQGSSVLEKKMYLGIFVCLDFAVTLNLRKAVHIVPICIMIDYFRALYHWRT